MLAPPPGLEARQVITLDEACVVRTGPVEFVHADRGAVHLAAGAGRHLRAYSEMYDCCRILMSALYSDTNWSVVGGTVTAESTPSTDMNTTHLGGG
jgi:hypothetical protein